MKAIEDVDPGLLRWVRSHVDRHEYDLEAGDDVIATLRWQKPVGSLAEAKSSQGEWTLKRSGFLSPSLVVRDSKSGADLAHLFAHFNHSTVRLPNGARYEWNRTGLMVPGWHFRDVRGQEVVSFEPTREHLRLEGGLLTVLPAARSLPELTLLLILGWYFIVLAWVEDEAAAASSAVLGATVGP
jgi:hypothetical protein